MTYSNTYSHYSHLGDIFNEKCQLSAIGQESTLHQLSPYIGKIKSTIANFLVENFTTKGNIILDPFCGAGTIPLEAWMQGRNVIANDLNFYAYTLTQAKLFPPNSVTSLLQLIEKLNKKVSQKKITQNFDVPDWVKNFFHNETLKETIAWTSILKEDKQYFLLSCLMGILHHQRPGFLSFPSSHTVPYLRLNKFPKEKFPHLYEYREVKERLINKVMRAYRRIPSLNYDLIRNCYNKDASNLKIGHEVDAIITSPPYMRQLDYARDNRLRLWFLGVHDYKKVDHIISPNESSFLDMISNTIILWDSVLKRNGKIILFLGDNYSKTHRLYLPELIEKILFETLTGYKLLFKHESLIPNNRRVRRMYKGNKQETILVFKKIGK